MHLRVCVCVCVAWDAIEMLVRKEYKRERGRGRQSREAKNKTNKRIAQKLSRRIH